MRNGTGNVPLCDRMLAKELDEGYVNGVGLTDDPNGDTRPMDVYAAKKLSVYRLPKLS